MTTIQSGSSSSMGLSLAHSGLATRPNQTGTMTYPKEWKSGGNWFNTSVFSQPAAGYYGNVGNGTIRGPGLANYNMAAYKSFAVAEQIKVQFRAEFFNVFNHTNPNGPNTSDGNANFGKITSANSSRVGQLSLNFSF
jgi:hypothetical protein